MFASKVVTAVPAFFAEREDGKKLPFVVSIRFKDANGALRLTPAVEKSIDRALQITGAEGVALANVSSTTPWDLTKARIERAMSVEGVVALFQCDAGEVAEQLQQNISEHYHLTLMKDLNAQT